MCKLKEIRKLMVEKALNFCQILFFERKKKGKCTQILKFWVLF